MHHIQEGPANRSFGLEVAKLAGVPTGVLLHARQKLGELESQQMVERPPAIGGQEDLFSTPTVNSPVLTSCQTSILTKCRLKRPWTRCTR